MISIPPLTKLAPKKPKKAQSLSNKIQVVITYGLIAVAIALTLIDILLTIPGAFGIMILCLSTALAWTQYRSFRRRRWRRGSRLLLVITVSCLVSLWWLTCMEPAYAQFFESARLFFVASFPASTAGIDIVFNALRALYILYLAVSFIGVINAVRQDEDWQTVARTPALVVVVITLADVLTTLITGTGGAG